MRKKVFSWLFLACLFTAGFSVGVYAVYAFAPLPDVTALKGYSPFTATKVLDRKGNLVGEFAIEKRNILNLSGIPDMIKAAFISAEDSRFYDHGGLDIPGIIRALVADISKLKFSQGGSTITQQLVKLLYLTPHKSIKRKILEMLLAIKVEKTLTKDEILGLYLNQIYFGEGAYGIDAASRKFFGKNPEELNLGEITLLAGIPKSPAFYSPRYHPERALIRRRYVLKRMVEEGYVSKTEASMASLVPYELIPREEKQKGSYFLEYVRNYLLKKYGYDLLYKGGLSVTTTMDSGLQEKAESELQNWVEKLDTSILEKKNKKENRVEETTDELAMEDEENTPDRLQGSLLSLEVQTGEVLAMVGGTDFNSSQFNRAIQSKRQPGSAFKPIIYTASIESGLTPADLIDDLPVEYVKNEEQNWRPTNYDRKFLGRITLMEALARSRNLATIRLLEKIGINKAKTIATKLGIESQVPGDLSIALGSVSISLLELCQAYDSIANLGKRPEIIFVKEVRDRNGTVLERNEPASKRVISPETAYIMTYMLQRVITNGTGRGARYISKTIAGKTGTTNDFIDAWFIGFSPRVLTGVWVGFDKPVSMGKSKTGAVAALPLWKTFMREALRKYPASHFGLAPGIIFARVDPKSGLRVSGEKGVMVPFKLGTTPPWSNTYGNKGRGKKKVPEDIL